MKEKLKESLDDILYVLCGDNTKNGVSRHQLKSLLMVVALDYQVRPPSQEQIEIIYLLLTRNSEQQIGRSEMTTLLEKIIDVYTQAQQQPISGHFQRIIMELHQI